jgi:hypothetical protein
MKQGRTRDGKDAAAGASALESSEMSGWVPPELSVLPLPGGDRDEVSGEPGDRDCPAVLQIRNTMIKMILFQSNIEI